MDWRERADTGAWRACVVGWTTSALFVGVSSCVSGALWLGPTTVGLLTGWALLSAFAFIRCASSMGHPTSDRQLMNTAGCVMVAIVVLVGAVQPLGWPGAAIVLLLVLGGWLLHRWRMTSTHRSMVMNTLIAAVTVPDAAVATPVRHGMPPTSLEASSVQQLCQLWCRSSTVLHQCTDARLTERLVRARQGYLEALERRDPDGVRRWLDAAPAVALDPLAFMTPDRT